MLFFACFTPIIDPLLSAYKLAFSNTNFNTIDESGTSSIFNGSTGVYSGLLNYDDFEFPNYGSVFGKISVEGTEINCDLIYGDDTALLKKGACLSLYSHIPGCGRGVMIAAHNNTYFHTLPNAKEGALVHLETNYGSYVYKVYRSEVWACKFDTDTDKNKKVKLLGYVRALIKAAQYKSGDYTDCTDIIYEEFIAEAGARYLPGEPNELQSFVSTVARLRKISVWLVGNTISLYVHTLRSGDWSTFPDRNRGQLIHTRLKHNSLTITTSLSR